LGTEREAVRGYGKKVTPREGVGSLKDLSGPGNAPGFVVTRWIGKTFPLQALNA